MRECLAGVRGHMHCGSCLPVSAQVLLIGPRTRPLSPSATGNALPSSDLDISCLSSPHPFGSIRASWAIARECFLKLDGIVFFVVPGVYVQVISSFCSTLLVGIGFV